MGLLDYKVYIKFDESVNYKDLNFLGSNSFNTVDFLNQKLGDNNFIEKAKKMLSDKMNSVSEQNPIFSQINDKMTELKEFYLFPVPPSELKFKSIGGWESVDTVNGILKLKNRNKLQSLAFSSIIPEQKYNFATHHLLDPFSSFVL